MSHFADDETIAMIAKLQATVQEQAAEIESLRAASELGHTLFGKELVRGDKLQKQLTDSQHKVKVLTDALSSIKHSMDMGMMLGNDKHRELMLSQSIAQGALATVKELK